MVARDRGPRVAEGARQLRDERRGAELSLIADPRGLVDVEIAGTARPRAREEQRRHLPILEDRGSRVVERRVHNAPEVLRRFPAQVIPLILPPRDVEICTATAAELEAVEVEMMAVGRKSRRRFVRIAVDARAEVLQRTPRIVDTGALRDPEIQAAKAARPVGGDKKAESILG